MSDDNIIRSSHHSVTIEKGSKNAKARSAHLEEGFNLEESVSTAPQDEQIFNKQIQFDTATDPAASENLFVQGAPLSSAAEKIAKLKAEVSQVHQTLDEEQTHSSAFSSSDSGTHFSSTTSPNVQNLSTQSGGLKNNQQTLATDGLGTPNVQAAHEQGLSTNIQPGDAPGSMGGANIQPVIESGGSAQAPQTPTIDISARPRPRGAAAMQALKEARARLAQASAPGANVQTVDDGALNANIAEVAQNGSAQDNLQNVPDSGGPADSRVKINPGGLSASKASVPSAGATKPANRAAIPAAGAKDNKAKVDEAALKSSKVSIPGSQSTAANNQLASDDQHKDNFAQLAQDSAGLQNRVAVESAAHQDRAQGVQVDAIKDNTAALPETDASKSNRAQLPSDSSTANAKAVQAPNPLNDNRQGLANQALKSNKQSAQHSPIHTNEAAVETSPVDSHQASLPKEEANKGDDLSIPKSHPSSNHQAVSEDSVKDNTAEIPSGGLASNHQGVEEPVSQVNHQGVGSSTQQSEQPTLAKDAISDDAFSEERDDPSHHNAPLPEHVIQDNTAEIPIDTHNDNEAQVGVEGVLVHREPVPEDHSGTVSDTSQGDSLSDSFGADHAPSQSAQAQASEDGFAGDSGALAPQPSHSGSSPSARILQTHASDSPQVQGQVMDADSRALQRPGSAQRVGAAGVAVKRQVKPGAAQSEKKGAPSNNGATAKAQEVRRASDTWAEAFRGRVAAISDQVNLLNKKLDKLDK